MFLVVSILLLTRMLKRRASKRFVLVESGESQNSNTNTAETSKDTATQDSLAKNMEHLKVNTTNSSNLK